MTAAFPKVHSASLRLVAESYSLRVDAKQADEAIRGMLNKVAAVDHFLLNEVLPHPFTKGNQPDYLDQPGDDSVPVINTLSIQNLSLNSQDCRHISREDFERLLVHRTARRNDVLLTVDGGVSIGKPCLFDSDEEYAIDSHVVILRPEGIKPLSLVYLLASPIGQLQFRRAESGSSGQTSVTEDDIRRFFFPRRILADLDAMCEEAERERQAIIAERRKLDDREQAIWNRIQLL